jgi:signal transduction histidine kinase
MNPRTLSKFLVIPTAAVVLILAGVLYRWSDEISKATSARLADSLQMSMANWHLNLYRDLSDVAGALRVDSENSGNLELYERRFREWSATAQYRDLVVDLFVVKAAEPQAQILRLNRETYVFGPADWPESLIPLQTELRKADADPAGNKGPAFPRGLAGWKFEADTPALVRPIESRPGTWLVAQLDKNAIQSKILPDLAKRYFTGASGGDELDYLIAVVSGPQQREVIYSSDPGFGAEEVSDADGRMDVFGQVTKRQFGASPYVFHELSESGKSVGIPSMGTQWFPLLNAASNESGWQLVVRHRRGGALGAFVAEMHRRDLAISFGVLFVLVALVAMLIVTSLRANRLAKLQMDFVTAISHELRSPLTIISSAAENITQGVVGSREQLEQYGKAIEGQTRQLSRLVEEVLLFAATRDERHRYNVRPLEVPAIIDATLAATSDLIEAAQFTVERDVPASLPQVSGDLSALSQCLQNLITNALKYSGKQRWIGIRASVHDEGNDREIRISVSDRGMGIDPHDLPRVFEPFFRSSSVTDAQIHGTGLGLSLAKNIAEAMQGQLTVVSHPGRGTTFTLHLPVSPNAPAFGHELPAKA